MSQSILERFPDLHGASLVIGSDDNIHLVDKMGGRWCEYDSFEEIEMFETVDDKPLSELCADCRHHAEEDE